MPESQSATPRWSSRDLVAPTAFFFGALLVAAAVAMGPLVGSGFTKIPLSIDQTWVGDGADGSRVLDRCSIDAPAARVLDAQVQQRRRIVAVRPADSEVVTLQAGVSLGVDHYLVDGRRVDADRVCKETTLTALIDRVTLNRRSAAPTGRSDIQYDDERAAVAVDGRRGRTYLLPFGFDAPGEFFDPVTRQTVPLRPMGESNVDGRPVVRLRAAIPEVDLGAAGTDPRGVIAKPAAWFGRFPGVAPRTELTASLHHRATRDLYVDVATGVVVDERVEIDEEYRFTAESAGRDPRLSDYRLTNLSIVVTGDRESRTAGGAAARDRARPVLLTRTVLPIGLGVLGALTLIGGGVIATRSARAPTASV